MGFEFATAGRIIFGCGSARQLGSCLRSIGRRVFVVTGVRWERYGELLDSIREMIEGMHYQAWCFQNTASPGAAERRMQNVQLLVESLRRNLADDSSDIEEAISKLRGDDRRFGFQPIFNGEDFTGWTGAVGWLSDLLAIVAIAIGLGGSVAMGVFQVKDGVDALFGLTDTGMGLTLGILAVLVLSYILPLTVDLGRGMALLSNAAMFVAAASTAAFISSRVYWVVSMGSYLDDPPPPAMITA